MDKVEELGVEGPFASSREGLFWRACLEFRLPALIRHFLWEQACEKAERAIEAGLPESSPEVNSPFTPSWELFGFGPRPPAEFAEERINIAPHLESRDFAAIERLIDTNPTSFWTGARISRALSYLIYRYAGPDP